MGKTLNKNYTKEDLLQYQGNEEEFKELNNKINQPFAHEVVLYDEKDKTRLLFMGHVKDKKFDGRGILYKDYTYDGYFKNGLKDGYFRVYKNNSTDLIYEGFYKEDKYQGKGILYDGNGNKIYNGYFYNGKYHEIGIEYFQKEKLKRKMFYENGESLKESFGVLYNEDNVIYQGLLKNLKPENGKNITIYDNKNFIIYVGDISCFEYNGKGILYYEESNYIYFDGFFDRGSYIKGKIYDPQGNLIYDGEFLNNQPKEIKNVNLYELNKKLKFTGDLSSGKYQDFGKLYQNNILLYEGYYKDGLYEGNGILYIDENTKYEGQFKKGKYNGKGKIIKEKYLYFEGEYLAGKKQGKGIYYYPCKQKYFEVNYENDIIKGEGVKYYDNGAKKIEAIFINSITCKGKYYNPNNELLYEGEMKNEIPINNENLKIYNDYTYKVYTLEKKDEIYNIINSEYNPNFFLTEKLTKKFSTKISFISFYSLSGKTALIERLINNKFKEESLSTVGMNFSNYNFEKSGNLFNVGFLDLNGQELTRETAVILSRGINFVIFTINVYDNGEIDENYIDRIRGIMNNDSNIIYLVGNKIINEYNDLNVENNNRNKAKELLKNKKIDKYFEVNAKTGEGIENLKQNINFDVIKFSE